MGCSGRANGALDHWPTLLVEATSGRVPATPHLREAVSKRRTNAMADFPSHFSMSSHIRHFCHSTSNE